ncbi:MAG: hypothetical protein ILP22_05240 [Oscillospiraceae bacterium]|nr:hypothetical protein [Oscillospiraceae bacterium]
MYVSFTCGNYRHDQTKEACNSRNCCYDPRDLGNPASDR